MNELIEAMLSLAKMSRGELRKTQLDLTAMARVITATLAQNEVDRSVTCLIAEGLSAYADEKLMHNVLQNLIGNALKYHKPDVSPVIQVQSQMLHVQADESGSSSAAPSLPQRFMIGHRRRHGCTRAILLAECRWLRSRNGTRPCR